MFTTIIAGTHKGRRVFSVPRKKKGVKPISARIKQSLFDIVRPLVPASYFLDLYAGIGAVSFEALSRGARRAVMVEKDKFCVKIIEKNAGRLGFGEKAVVLRADVMGGLEWLNHYSDYEGYDIIFIGAPYRDRENMPLEYSMKTLRMMERSPILSKNGVMVCQHHFREAVEAPKGFFLYRREKYGDTLLSFMKRDESSGKRG